MRRPLSPRLRTYVEPTLELIRPLPASAVIPVFVLMIGLNERMIISVIAFASLWPVLLATVHGVGVALVVLCVVSSVGETIYWSAYHAYFAAVGDDEHRGHQIGLREAVAAVVGIASPLATGWLLVTFGPQAAFGATAAVVLVAALPLLWAPDIRTARHVNGSLRAAMPAALVFAADGWTGVGAVFGGSFFGGCFFTIAVAFFTTFSV